MTMTKAASAIAAIAVILTGTAAASTADAQSWRRGNDRGGWNRGGDWNRGHNNWNRRHDRGRDVAAAAVIAGVAGLVIGSALSSNNDRAPEPYYDGPVEDPCAYQDCSAQTYYDGAGYADPYNEGYVDPVYVGDEYGYDAGK